MPVVVKDLEKPQPVTFRNDLIASLNVGGCNAGACHGTPSGKNGFKLSLRGLRSRLPTTSRLTRNVLGRRSDRNGPDSSLIMQKALGRVPHEGGARLPASSIPARTMHGWLAEGMNDDDPKLPTLTKIDVLPGSRVLNEPARWQQLSVLVNLLRRPGQGHHPPDRVHQQRQRHRHGHADRPGRV